MIKASLLDVTILELCGGSEVHRVFGLLPRDSPTLERPSQGWSGLGLGPNSAETGEGICEIKKQVWFWLKIFK